MTTNPENQPAAPAVPQAAAATQAPPAKKLPPYRQASRLTHPENTVVKLGTHSIGGEEFVVMAGPCSVEADPQMLGTAWDVKISGAHIIRGGAFKPRSSPYSFQGLAEEGLKMLAKARELTGLGIVTEVMDSSDIDLVESYADILQVGARNSQNFSLLKRLSKTRKPILLKRGLMNTVEEFLCSAEYLLAGGNEKVILCERGIRTFETSTRNTLDLSSVLAIKERSHLPVIVDPSHASGKAHYVAPLSRAALAVGADGLMIEVHCAPELALCDGDESLTPETFKTLMADLARLAPHFGRRITTIENPEASQAQHLARQNGQTTAQKGDPQ
ncbi:MAG: 3-deoxy-7-phosphoheptulonate synthase [Deltaproteobacteria bacterium]|jgi:3-deoxy-7-phosphoheptulonate synthase|nr:3-deoxy-7-phosphoheptulonate synthase [Deltaproteobacteria bacterium]